MAKQRRGFSLLELMAAMAIVALALVIAAPPVATMLDKLAFRKEVNGVMAQIRGWKLLAVSTGKTVAVTLDEDVLLVQLGQEEQERKPVQNNITLAMEPSRILFSPEGWATPAIIEISSTERHRKLRIAPLTGRPRKL